MFLQEGIGSLWKVFIYIVHMCITYIYVIRNFNQAKTENFPAR